MKKRRAKKHITRDEVPLGVRVLLFVALVAAIFATLWMSKKELVLANTSPTMVNVTGIEEVGGNGQICLKTRLIPENFGINYPTFLYPIDCIDG